MGALGHYLEDEGIPTTQISLVREHTAALNPPRALWVPFMLGRPFGVPGDSAFQRKVLLAALSLLERSEGPVIEDFPEDAPHAGVDEVSGGEACPVSFAVPASSDALTTALTDEISQLRVWHEIVIRRRGKTTLGVTGLSIEEIADFLLMFVTGSSRSSFRPGLAIGSAVKLATDELKAFYYEAVVAQPGKHSSASIDAWFWNQTAAGKLFLALHSMARNSDEASLKALAVVGLVPRAVAHALGEGDSG